MITGLVYWRRYTSRAAGTVTGIAVRFAICAGRRRYHHAIAERSMHRRIPNCSGAMSTLAGQIRTATLRRGRRVLRERRAGQDRGEKNDREKAFHVLLHPLVPIGALSVTSFSLVSHYAPEKAGFRQDAKRRGRVLREGSRFPTSLFSWSQYADPMLAR